MTTQPSPYESPADPDPDSKSGVRTVMNRLEINATVAWAVTTRAWQILAGAVSFLMIASCLTPVEQGFYVTFWSFIAVQTLIDLGFSIAILNFSSHEWAQLKLDENGCIVGDSTSLSRLVSLGRIAFRWFGVAALLFVLIAGSTGELIFTAKHVDDVSWRVPWWTVVILSGGSLWTMPFLSLLEGCGQIESVYRFRFRQAVLTNLAVWGSLLSGLGLWAVVASASMRLGTELLFLLGRYRRFFRPFFRPPRSEVLHWRQDIWPMQWRLAVGGAFNYFAVFLFSPVMVYHSYELAGQMGMTRQLLMALQSASQSWVQARVPVFGQLVAKKDYSQLNAVFRRVTTVSFLVLIVGGIGFLLFLFGLEYLSPKLAARVLGPFPTAVMLLAMLAFQLPFCQTLYLRAHRAEPVMWPTVASNLGIAVGVTILGLKYADIGAAFGHLLPVTLITLPLIHRVWVRCRREWHSEAASA